MTLTSIRTLRAATLCLLLVAGGAAAQESVLFSFSGADGASPQAGLLLEEGNFFGTTVGGGSGASTAAGFGTVFELSPASGKGWTEKTIYRFAGGADGASPISDLIADGHGNLYGTTYDGGADGDYGTAFELLPTKGGDWTKKIIYSFGAYYTDGQGPHGGLILDPNGNLYGTTYNGGTGRVGTVFELVPSSEGNWTEEVLHDFHYDYIDGSYPVGDLAFDSSGNLFGTSSQGGMNGSGTVFELTRQQDGAWAESLLHQFGSPEVQGDGQIPFAGVILDSKGNVYGTTALGGIAYGGTAFELSPVSGGGWAEKVFDFTTSGDPSGGLAMDTMGNLYISDLYNGGIAPSGTIFKLTPKPNAPWAFEILHAFPPSDGISKNDGSEPNGVILDAMGNIYGTTVYGGTYNLGTVFEIAAATLPPVATTTILTVNPDSNPIAGEPITLTAIVTPVSGTAIPSGTVTFIDPAGGSAAVPVISGKAVYTNSVPRAGTYSVYASFSSDTNFVASTSATITETVVAPEK